jgi:hypothetical protein
MEHLFRRLILWFLGLEVYAEDTLVHGAKQLPTRSDCAAGGTYTICGLIVDGIGAA